MFALEKERFIGGFHQQVQKPREKSWHEMHIKKNSFTMGGDVLLYDRKLLKLPGNLRMHWLGPFIVVELKDSGDVKLTQLYGIFLPVWVNET